MPKVHILPSRLNSSLSWSVDLMPRNPAFIRTSQLSSGIWHVSFSAPSPAPRITFASEEAAEHARYRKAGHGP